MLQLVRRPLSNTRLEAWRECPAAILELTRGHIELAFDSSFLKTLLYPVVNSRKKALYVLLGAANPGRLDKTFICIIVLQIKGTPACERTFADNWLKTSGIESCPARSNLVTLSRRSGLCATRWGSVEPSCGRPLSLWQPKVWSIHGRSGNDCAASSGLELL